MVEALAERQEKRFDPTQGRDELNFAEFPLFYLGQRVPKDLTELTFESEITDAARNRTVKRKIVIKAGQSEGIPLSRDMDVLHALIALAKHDHDLQTSIVHFSRYQLCEILGWSHNGKSYKRIEEALRKWLEVTIYYESWWDRDKDNWRNLKGFHILDDIELNEVSNGGKPGRVKQTELPFSSVRFGQRVFDSLRSGNVKRLNLVDVFHLTLPMSKRLYGFLDKRFYHRKRLDFDLRTLACEHVGMSRDYKPSEFKRKLFPAIEELVALGFLEPMTFEQRYTKTGHGFYQVHFARQQRQELGTLPLPGSRTEKTAARGLVKLLIDHGMTAATARQFVEDKTIADESIKLQIDVLEWKLEQPDEYTISNPGGYLREAISKGHAPPPKFQPKAAREAARQKAQEAASQKAEDARKKREAEEDRKRRDKAERMEREQRVSDFMNALSERRRQEVIDEAIQNANPMMRKRARMFLAAKDPKANGEGSYRLVLEDHVLTLIDGQPAK